MALRYPELFTPFKIGKCTIKNRIVMEPMMITGLIREDGQFTEETISYYEERAKGGAGLIVTYAILTNLEFEHNPYCKPWKDPYSFVLRAKKLCDRIHNYDCKIFMQIGMGGGRCLMPSALAGGVHIGASPTENRWDPSIIGRAMTKDEIQQMIDALADGAFLCKQAGADGVEVHSLYGGYMGDTFAMTIFNQRTDEYGGDLRGRLKMACDTVKAIKARCGQDFPVSLRFGVKHYMKGLRQGALPGEDFVEVGRDVEESLEAAKILEEAGYDALNVANGSYDSWYWAHPPMYHEDGCWLETGARLKEAVNIPVINAGKINLPEMANDAVKKGMLDGVGMARAFWADAYWPKKANEGRPEDIRPCIGCHNGCMARIFVGKPVTCAVNPDLGLEYKGGPAPAKEKKNICVIGAGVAGMEAALNAAVRGHQVDLYEKENYLGGVLYPASVPSFKDADRRLIHWYERELKKAGVNVHLNTEMTVDMVRMLHPDEVIVATGAKPKIPPVPGKEKAVTAVDVLMGKASVGQKCVIIGGGQVGCELAVWLKQQGKDAVVVEALSELMIGGAEEIPIPNRLMLIDMLPYNKVDVKTSTKLTAIEDGAVRVEGPQGEETIPADTVVFSVGYYADKTFANALKQEMPNVWTAGDQNAPTNILYAVAAGSAIGRMV